jgi:exopolysaccharide production protein ExoQ
MKGRISKIKRREHSGEIFTSAAVSCPFYFCFSLVEPRNRNAGGQRPRMSTGALNLPSDHVSAPPAPLLAQVIGFFFSFRTLCTVLAVRVLQQDTQTGVVVSLALNFLLLGAVVFDSLGPARRSLASIFRLPGGWSLLLFLGFSGCSLTWSAAVSRSAAAAFWCAMVADLGMVALLLRNGPISETGAALMKGYVRGACCVALAAWMMPGLSDLRLGDEELMGPNQIGYPCALAIFFAQFLIRMHNQGRWRFSITFLAITLLRSLSKTTIVAFVAGEAVLLVLDRHLHEFRKRCRNPYRAFWDMGNHPGPRSRATLVGAWIPFCLESDSSLRSGPV